MPQTLKSAGIFAVTIVVAAIMGAQPVSAATINATSCTTAAVQAAVNAAVGGDTVVVPAGACSWTSGVTISGKAISLRGVSLGAVTITNNNSGGADMITITEATAGHIEISQLIFDGPRTTGVYHQILVLPAGSGRAVLIHNNTFNGFIGAIRSQTIRGVIWSNTFDAGVYTGSLITSEALQVKAQSAGSSWTTPATMGMDDTTGESNLYFENNTINQHHTETLDFDDNSRVVVRYNTFTNSGFTSHGQDTSAFGARHWEIYNNTFIFSNFGDCDGLKTANLNYWFFVRGGTGIIANNSMPDLVSCAWGDKSEIHITDMPLRRNAGPNACWTGGYPVPRQPGQGHNGTSYFTDPIYIWGNTGLPSNQPGLTDYGPDECGGGAPVADYIKPERDYIVGTPRPGYTPYPYPHPLAGAPDTVAPSIPTNLAATTVSTVQINLTWTASSDDSSVAGYRIFRNGVQVGMSNTTSFQDTGLSPSTSYSYTVSAYDPIGNNSAQSSSASATTIAIDTTAPTVSMTAPANGASLPSSTVIVSASAADNVGVVGVQFTLDGANLGTEDTAAPYSISWNTATATNGPHTLAAVARDAAGNMTTASARSVTVDKSAPTISISAPAPVLP